MKGFLAPNHFLVNSEIKKALVKKLGRGVTVFAGSGGRVEVKRDILFCVVTRYEIPKIK